jgi:hypothetical protein
METGARQVKVGDWVHLGRAYREVVSIERVSSPHRNDRPWVQLVVDRDGAPHALDPMPPDWPVEADRPPRTDAGEGP